MIFAKRKKLIFTLWLVAAAFLVEGQTVLKGWSV